MNATACVLRMTRQKFDAERREWVDDEVQHVAPLGSKVMSGGRAKRILLEEVRVEIAGGVQ